MGAGCPGRSCRRGEVVDPETAQQLLQENAQLQHQCALLEEENQKLQKELERSLEESAALQGGAGGQRKSKRGVQRDESSTEHAKKVPMTGSLHSSVPVPMLNTLIQHLWPRISEYVLDVLGNNLELGVRNLAPPLNKFTLVRDQSYLGIRPVQFLDVRWGQEVLQTADEDMTNFVLHAKLEWDGREEHSCISLKLAGVGLSISNILIRGDLIVELVGMIDKPPLFRGVRAFFLNMPEIDFEVQGSAASLSPAAVKRSVIDVITSLLSSKLVLPNRIGMKLAKDADIFSIIAPPPEGLLLMMVCSADGLRGLDTNIFSANTSDPFVQVCWAGQIMRSPTQFKNLSPNFSFIVPLLISSSAHQRVTIEIINENLVTQNSLLGRVSIPISEMTTWKPDREESFKLTNDHGKSGKNGKVTLSAVWRPLLTSSSTQREDQMCIVSVGVYAALHVPCAEERTQHWVTVQCSHLVEGADSGPAVTAKLSHRDVADAALAESEIMLWKLEVLRKYKMTERDMASVLEVDPQTLGNIAGSMGLFVGRCELLWNQAFHFVVRSANKASLDFSLQSRSPTHLHGRELGTYSFDVSSLLRTSKMTFLDTVKLTNSNGIYLKLRVQVRLLGASAHVSAARATQRRRHTIATRDEQMESTSPVPAEKVGRARRTSDACSRLPRASTQLIEGKKEKIKKTKRASTTDFAGSEGTSSPFALLSELSGMNTTAGETVIRVQEEDKPRKSKNKVTDGSARKNKSTRTGGSDRVSWS